MQEEIRDIGGLRTRLLRGGRGRDTLVFLHGGTAGLTPYCGSSDLWGGCLDLFAAERAVVALDFPGAGGSVLPAADWPLIEGQGRHLRQVLEDLRLGPVHLVGHDEGGLVALWLAMEVPAAVRSVAVVASPTAAPAGDGVGNLALAHPPLPLWSRQSQAWALDRLSYSHLHIDEALLDRCSAWGASAIHRSAVERLKDERCRQAWFASIARAKARFFEICRGEGFPVPAQIIWGTHDPLTSTAHGFVLYKIIAGRQAAAHFHLINRAGAFLFREEPEAFHQIVAAFCDGLANSHVPA